MAKYDIFVIPPSSAGSGFLYLPSLQTQTKQLHRRSGLHRGSFSHLLRRGARGQTVGSPRLSTEVGGGILLLMVAIGVISWAWGKTQAEGKQGGAAGSGTTPGAGGFTTGSAYPSGGTTGAGPSTPGGAKPSWQRTKPHTAPGAGSAKTSWEKAREEGHGRKKRGAAEDRRAQKEERRAGEGKAEAQGKGDPRANRTRSQIEGRGCCEGKGRRREAQILPEEASHAVSSNRARR